MALQEKSMSSTTCRPVAARRQHGNSFKSMLVPSQVGLEGNEGAVRQAEGEGTAPMWQVCTQKATEGSGE